MEGRKGGEGGSKEGREEKRRGGEGKTLREGRKGGEGDKEGKEERSGMKRKERKGREEDKREREENNMRAKGKGREGKFYLRERTGNTCGRGEREVKGERPVWKRSGWTERERERGDRVRRSAGRGKSE